MDAVSQDNTKSLRCLLMPLRDYNIIVPHSTVDEILPFAVVDAKADSQFIIADLQWRRETIPLVSLEVLNKAEAPELQRRTRAAVMHVFSMDSGIQNFAIVLSGMPKMLVLSGQDIVDVDEQTLPNCTLKKVEVNNVPAYIPDLDALEYILNKQSKSQ